MAPSDFPPGRWDRPVSETLGPSTRVCSHCGSTVLGSLRHRCPPFCACGCGRAVDGRPVLLGGLVYLDRDHAFRQFRRGA